MQSNHNILITSDKIIKKHSNSSIFTYALVFFVTCEFLTCDILNFFACVTFIFTFYKIQIYI